MRYAGHRTRAYVVLGTLWISASLLSPPASARAQEAPSDITLVGVLVDATNGARLPETLVTLVAENRVTLTDAQGVFTFEEVPLGEHQLTFRQYGYEDSGARVTIRDQSNGPLTFEMAPNPLLVDGVTAVVDRLQEAKRRLESRRRATAVSVRNFGQNRLLRTTARNMSEFLRLDAALPRTSCGFRRQGEVCYFIRGRVTTPRVYIDEAPMIGGITMLETYRPDELYSVEFYQGGREIRAYTHQFMERMARRPVALIPIELPGAS